MSYLEWGNITWKFFHTLAEKIDETKFPEIRDSIINIILEVCDNLPCPICKNDAANILKYAYVKNIKTKKHLIEFLRQFHNLVNMKLDKKTYSADEINSMYNNVNLKDVVSNFTRVYKKRNFNLKLLNNNLQKKIFVESVLIKLNKIKFAIIF
jgi:hypothetical protein